MRRFEFPDRALSTDSVLSGLVLVWSGADPDGWARLRRAGGEARQPIRAQAAVLQSARGRRECAPPLGPPALPHPPPREPRASPPSHCSARGAPTPALARRTLAPHHRRWDHAPPVVLPWDTPRPPYPRHGQANSSRPTWPWTRPRRTRTSTPYSASGPSPSSAIQRFWPKPFFLVPQPTREPRRSRATARVLLLRACCCALGLCAAPCGFWRGRGGWAWRLWACGSACLPWPWS